MIWRLGRSCELAAGWRGATRASWKVPIKTGGWSITATRTAIARSAGRLRSLYDDFSANRFGIQWSFHQPGPRELERARYDGQALSIAGKGKGPEDCSPLVFVCGDHAYEVGLTLEPAGGPCNGRGRKRLSARNLRAASTFAPA